MKFNLEISCQYTWNLLQLTLFTIANVQHVAAISENDGNDSILAIIVYAGQAKDSGYKDVI